MRSIATLPPICHPSLRFFISQTLFSCYLEYLAVCFSVHATVGPGVELCSYGGYLLAGFGFGGVWPLMVLIVSERWGQQHLAGNYMFYDGVTAAIGALIFGKILPQIIYEQHADQDHGNRKHIKCVGPDCFGATLQVIAAAALLGAVAAIILTFRTRRLYRTICQRLTSQKQ